MAQFQYRDPAVVGGPLYWSLSGQYMRTDNDDASVNGIMVPEERQEAAEGDDDVARFALEDLDLTALLGWHSNAGPLEDYRTGLYLEFCAGLSRRHLTDRYPLGPRDYLLDPAKALKIIADSNKVIGTAGQVLSRPPQPGLPQHPQQRPAGHRGERHHHHRHASGRR